MAVQSTGEIGSEHAGEEGLVGFTRPQGAGGTALEWAMWIEELRATGYSSSEPLERYARDAKLTQIYEGTNQIQPEVLARRLLGRP